MIAQAEGDTAASVRCAKNTQGPEVTRQRLYLDAVQGVMENTSKVVVDVEGGNNLLYLPLDKIMTEGSRGQARGGSPAQSMDIRELTDRVVEQLRRDNAARSNSRGGR